ncbi:MAG: sigma-54 dependent transcriptional regulator [Deltaproteobacteria bacterium]
MQYLISLCQEISTGQYGNQNVLFELTKEGVYPPLVTKLAEAFGMMMIQVESRQYHLECMIDDLRAAQKDLQEARDRLSHENRDLQQTLQKHFDPVRLIGKSPALSALMDQVRKIADSPVNILMTGETGTGKELVAKTIHYSSSRCCGPFVALNCSAIPESIFESEMFGVEKGVATGVEKRMGRIEQANGGTLFFDEIGDMPAAAQAKILRVLQDRLLERVGGRKSIPVDIRVIAATNQDLREAVAKKTFRADLFYRLNVVHLHLPPLRERSEDIPLLMNYFLEQSIKRLGKAPKRFARETVQELSAYDWPGNIRELENEVERAVALSARDVITPEDLRDQVRKKPPAVAPGSARSLKDAEHDLIVKTLKATGGNRSEAAKRMGMSREGLRKKMKRYGMTG